MLRAIERIMNDIDNALWQWSLQVYQKSAVASALLALQDEGEDVLWLLYLLWCSDAESSATALEKPSVSYLEWRETMIIPIRQLRISCDKKSPVREKLLAAELAAEQQGIAILYADHGAINNPANNNPVKPQGTMISRLADADHHVPDKKAARGSIEAHDSVSAIEGYTSARSNRNNANKWDQLLQEFRC